VNPNMHDPWLHPEHSSEDQVWMLWLVRLRWVAITFQLLTVSFSLSLFHRPSVVLPYLLGLILLLAMANLLAIRILASGRPIHKKNLLSQLVLDILVLTLFFLLSGGYTNPFTILYMVHVAMGAVMLGPRLSAALSTLVFLCYMVTHAVYLPLHLEHHSMPLSLLNQTGPLVAFGISTVSITVFILGLSSSLGRRKQQLLASREKTARTDRLRSVGTMAAGAAHELNTPLSTIGLRTRRLTRRHVDEETGRDTQVILEQLARCTRVVEQLLVGAGDPSASGLEERRLITLVEEGVRLWGKDKELTVDIHDRSHNARVEVPRVSFIQALINLLENAREAQMDAKNNEPVEVHLWEDRGRGIIEIRDRGTGLPDDIDQIGTPFYTTKDSGTGLGVFVAQAVADGAGGGLSYLARDGGGTIAQWWFPLIDRRPT
jgi:two-component system sensor histidine kinase RegB